MYGVLVVLGWNEAMAVLFNPLYFAMLLILGASASVHLSLRDCRLILRYIILQLAMASFQPRTTRTPYIHSGIWATDETMLRFASTPRAARPRTHL
jgi:hypothetical protein